MEQDKLFYNASRDTWNFAKNLTKPGSTMSDDEWTAAIKHMDELTQKYASVGEDEKRLMARILQAYLDYVEKK